MDHQLRRRDFQTQGFEIARVIAHLIRNPGYQFHARELAALDSPQQQIEPHFDENVGAAVSTDLGDAGVVLDAKAVAEYRRRLQDLRPELEEAERCNDLGRVSLLREEAEVLTAELTTGVGFQGRERRTSSHSERARLSVFKNIRGAIEKIREANPALGRHLANSIKTGFLSSYSQTRPIPSSGASDSSRIPLVTSFVTCSTDISIWIFTPRSLRGRNDARPNSGRECDEQIFKAFGVSVTRGFGGGR